MASVHDWLEGVKVGYGGKFVAAFEEVGAEDAADIADFGVDEISSVEALLLRAGAKQLHVKKIREAIAREVGPSCSPFLSRGNNFVRSTPPEVCSQGLDAGRRGWRGRGLPA